MTFRGKRFSQKSARALTFFVGQGLRVWFDHADFHRRAFPSGP
jgi:hypothetical protein